LHFSYSFTISISKPSI